MSSRHNLPLYSVWALVLAIFLAAVLMSYWEALGLSLLICLGESILWIVGVYLASRRLNLMSPKETEAHIGRAGMILFVLTAVLLLFRLQPPAWSFGIRGLVPDSAATIVFAVLWAAALLLTTLFQGRSGHAGPRAPRHKWPH